eukprot:GHVR01177051.1.p2 GENE.GHVR01177051.1~~GHVR01177051.1.p2  ORF type:complete len:122 (-),score=10.21 GHVR01177051.1:4959-5324(-)
MFQKGSFTIPSDSSGILLVKVIQSRKCSNLRHAKVGSFLNVVIRNTKPELLKKRKKKLRSIVIRSSHNYLRIDGLTYCFNFNALVLLKKRMNTVGKEVFGPTCKELKIKKFRIPFKKIYKL